MVVPGAKRSSYAPLAGEDVLQEEGEGQAARDSPVSTRTRPAWIVHGALFALWIIVFAVPLWESQIHRTTASLDETRSLPGLYTPAPVDIVEYEYRTFSGGVPGDSSVYVGEPNDANEEQWAQLRRLGFIDLEHHEVEKLLNTSANATTSYVGGVGVFHQLHCVYSMRKMLYSPESIPHMKDHVVHCIELLRQAIMCHGDLDIDTHVYDPASGELDVHSPTFKGPKLCRKFPPLKAWGEMRKSKLYSNFPSDQH